jgi:hypothetical protein
MKSSFSFGQGSVWALGVVALSVVALGVSACGDDKEPFIPATEQAYLRVIHLSPDAPAVDVLVNGQTRAVQDLSFLETTDYISIDEGTYTFDVVPMGGSAADSVLRIADLNLDGKKYYTAVAIGTLSSIRALALVDDFAGLDAGNIRVRAIHAAAGVGEVDIWNIPEMGAATPLYENVPFGGVGDYLDLPAGAYKIGIDVDNDANPDLTFSLPALSGGTIANVFAVNNSQGEVFLYAQLQDSAAVRFDPDAVVQDFSEIRVLHLSPDAPGVDIWVDGIGRAIEDLRFPQGTDYVELESGTYTFRVLPTGGTVEQSVLDIENLILEPDQRYTAVAFGPLNSIQALALVDDTSGLAMGDIRIRPIHTAVGVGQVDIWYLPEMGAPALLYEDVDFGAVGNFLDLPAAAYTLGFDVDNDASPDVIFNIPELPAGTVANVFAVTDATGDLSLKAQLDSSAIASIDPAVGQVRVLHLSYNAPPVDVFIDTVRSIVGLDFLDSTPFLDLNQGSYDFAVSPTGRPIGENVLNLPGLRVLDQKRYTAVAYGPAATIGALWLEDDFTNLADGFIRVRAIHTASVVGQVDIWNIPSGGGMPSLLYENVDYGVAGGYLDLPAGAYTIGFDVDDDSSPDVVFDLPALGSGTVANVFAASDSMGQVFLAAQLEDGTTVRIDPTL